MYICSVTEGMNHDSKRPNELRTSSKIFNEKFLMFMKNINLYIAVVQILLNIIFIAPVNVKIIYTTGGPMGYGLVLLPFTILLFILSVIAFAYAVITLKKIEKTKMSLLLNGITLISMSLFIKIIILESQPSLMEAIKSVWS